MISKNKYMHNLFKLLRNYKIHYIEHDIKLALSIALICLPLLSLKIVKNTAEHLKCK